MSAQLDVGTEIPLVWRVVSIRKSKNKNRVKFDKMSISPATTEYLSAYDVERIASSLNKIDIDEYSSPKWQQQQEYIDKLNIQVTKKNFKQNGDS